MTKYLTKKDKKLISDYTKWTALFYALFWAIVISIIPIYATASVKTITWLGITIFSIMFYYWFLKLIIIFYNKNKGVKIEEVVIEVSK